MFRCKRCGVRMFERDCAGHLYRHGLQVTPGKVASHFEMGPVTARSRPGDGVKPLYYQHGKKKARPAPVAELDPDVDDLN